jgi:hypothetical protein
MTNRKAHQHKYLLVSYISDAVNTWNATFKLLCTYRSDRAGLVIHCGWYDTHEAAFPIFFSPFLLRWSENH